MPIKKAGPETIRYAKRGRALVDAKIMYNNPVIINKIPPTYSYFHAIIKKIIKIKDGIKCINRAIIVSRKE